MQIRPTAPTLNPALRQFWTIPARNRVLFGGRISSKSWDAAGFAIYLASNYRVKFLCARQFQNKISESVYTLLKIQIERFGLRSEFKITKNSIIHLQTGSEFIFYGLWRHIDEIKSTEGVDVCWIEEAHNLTKEQWEILEPTVRKSGSQFWIIFNPKLISDFVYQKFVAGTPDTVIAGKVRGTVGATIKRHINYDENPFVEQTMLDVIDRKRTEDYDDYMHIYHGVPLLDDDQVIIKRSWIIAALNAHEKLGIEPNGEKRIGFDVADSGVDKNATVSRNDFLAYHIDEWKGQEDELMKSAKRVHARAVFSRSQVDYDSIGVGAFAGSYFDELNEASESPYEVEHFKFNAGGAVVNPDAKVDPDNPKSPTNKEHYENIKAQAWWHVSRRFQHTYNVITKGHELDSELFISISADCDNLDKLVTELSTPRKDTARNGKSKVESKADLLKRDIPSTNIADAFVMAFGPRAAPSVSAALFLSKRNRR